jgi:hypothetical protein
VLLVAALVAIWLFTPTWAAERGIDAKDLYAAASLQSRGGNPYDPEQQRREQDRLFNIPSHILPGQGGHAHAPYGYPPLFTAALRAALPMGFGLFYLAAVALLLAAGMGGFEAILEVAGWRRRWLARGFFLASMPMALSLFVGNPSPLLLFGWAMALLLARRGRPFAAGLVLTLCLLKLPVGLPAAAALIAGVGSGRLLLAAGLGVGTAVVGSLQVLLTGPGATLDWVRSLGGYASGLKSGSSAFSQSGLAGVPSLFIDFLPPLAAVVIGVALVAVILTWAGTRLSAAGAKAPNLWLAVLLVAAVGLTPYLHLNDLVLLALPLLLLAQTTGGFLARLTELTWFLGIPARLLLATLAAAAFNLREPAVSAGAGVVLLLLLLVALPMASARSRPVTPEGRR